jgi:hypothetical protein
VEFYLLVIIMRWCVYLGGKRGARGDLSVWYERDCRDWELELESLELLGCDAQRLIGSGNDDEVDGVLLCYVQSRFLSVVCHRHEYRTCSFYAHESRG